MARDRSSVVKAIKREKASYAMLAPNFIMFAVFSIYPIFWALRFMFYEYSGFGDMTFVGWENFVRIFTRDPVFWRSVVNTLIYIGGKLILTIPISLLCAVLLQKQNRFNAVSQAVIFSPTIMSTAVMALIFYLLFNTYNGEVNRMLTSIGLIKQPINWLGADLAMITVIIVAIWGAIGNYMVYFLAGLTGISGEIYESASIDGANGAQAFFRITLPMLSPVLKNILLLALVNSFMDMSSVMVLTGGGPFGKTEVMSLYVYQLFFPITAGSTVVQEFGYGATAGVVSALIVSLFTLFYLWVARRLDSIFE